MSIHIDPLWGNTWEEMNLTRGCWRDGGYMGTGCWRLPACQLPCRSLPLSQAGRRALPLPRSPPTYPPPAPTPARLSRPSIHSSPAFWPLPIHHLTTSSTSPRTTPAPHSLLSIPPDPTEYSVFILKGLFHTIFPFYHYYYYFTYFRS